MQLLRSIILIIAVLLQAMPVAAVAQGDAAPVCRMKCCATGATSCCCAEPAQAPSLPAPANTPPVTGRELVPATMWVACISFLPLEAGVEEAAKAQFHVHDGAIQPHVRLPVLFCSILI